MVEIGKIKIKKKSYQFEVKKRFQPVRHFKIKERSPLERIKDQLNAILAPKKVEKKREFTTAPPPGGFNYVVFGAAVLIALIILGVGWLYVTLQLMPVGPGVFQPPSEKPDLQNVILDGTILTSGERGTQDHVAALLVDYETRNLNNYTVKLTTYNEKLPSQVFMLESDRDEATTYPDFLRALRSNLAKRKIMLNSITEKQLETIPEGAIVVVPSSYVPASLIGIGSSVTMDNLADRGVVVIYIGQPFTQFLNGTSTPLPTPQEKVSALPVGFESRTDLNPTDDFQLFQPLYRVTARGGWKSTMIYGCVSVAKKGNGGFIFIPETLDGGWRDPNAAAEDVSRIIFDTPWAEPTGAPRVYEFANSTNYSGTSYFFSNPFRGENVSVKAEFIGYSSASAYPVQETLVSYQRKAQLGELYIQGGVKIVPTSISGLQARLNAKLQEPEPGQRDLLLVVLSSNGTEVQTITENDVSLQGEKPIDMPIEADRGEYLVRLVDDQDNVYAQSYMKVVSIDVTYVGVSTQRRSVYFFDVTRDGTPVSLADVTIKVDDGQFGTYDFKTVQQIAVDVGSYTGGDYLPYGNHTFEFTTGGLTVKVPVSRIEPPNPLKNPLFWVTAILTLGIVGVGIIFARQETTYFAIDIPDFPPVARTKVPLSPDVILSIFQKVNENYRWQNTPLTSVEIKNGFKDIFYKGRPVYVTDYNVEYLLEELEKKRLVKESMGYYGLETWEEKTSHTINYLAMMRRLRDICVNNAVPFTSLGESEVADSEITVVGQQMFLHFFEKSGSAKTVIQRVLSTLSKGITIILFKSDAEKAVFQSTIQSASLAPLILRMESDSGSILFLTSEEFEKMLVEFKTM